MSVKSEKYKQSSILSLHSRHIRTKLCPILLGCNSGIPFQKTITEILIIKGSYVDNYIVEFENPEQLCKWKNIKKYYINHALKY
jgi:hypothetical protein